MSGPVRIAVVMACFNRKQTTLRCLTSLFGQSGDLELSVHLLDDASPDGTRDALRHAFPQVEVLAGDGNCFWGGGMHLAMQAAMKREFDFMLWLNDDVELALDALQRLIAAHACARETRDGLHVIVGAMADPASGAISYAGFNRRSAWHPARLRAVHPADDRLTPCDTMNGNCVLVPAAVVEKVGLIDPVFVQQLGDIDYGYRVRRAGGQIWIAPEVAGTCAPNLRSHRWNVSGLSFLERFRLLNTPHGLPIRSWVAFYNRYAGVFGPSGLRPVKWSIP